MIYKDNQIKQLRAFYYTAKFSSVTLAANYLGLTQPTVSLQISSLEKQCGHTLFTREKNKMQLTEVGAELVEKSSELLTALDQLFKKHPKQSTKRLNIAANNGSLNYVLPNIVSKFCESNHDTFLKIHYAAKEQGLKMLLNNEADIFFTPKNINIDERFIYYEYAKYPVLLITHPNHPLAKKQNITLNDISQAELVMPPAELAVIENFYQIVTNAQKQKQRCRIEFSNWEISKKFVSQNLFVAIVASLVVEEYEEFFTYDLSEFFAPISYGYVIVKDKYDKLETKDFLNFLQNHQSFSNL